MRSGRQGACEEHPQILFERLRNSYAQQVRAVRVERVQYPYSLCVCHTVQPLIMEVLGGFHPDMVRYIDGLARAHGARLGADELTAPWSARSFRALHVQRISVALQLAAAEEILDTILLDRSAAAMRGEDTC